MLQCLESDDLMERNAYMSIMMQFEEIEHFVENVSYYDAIKQKADYKIQQSQQNTLAEMLKREEEQRKLEE